MAKRPLDVNNNKNGNENDNENNNEGASFDNINIAATYASQSELVKFACNVVSNTFNGLDFDTVMKIANNDFNDLIDDGIIVSDSVGFDPVSIAVMIQQIIEMVMELIENCKNKPLLSRLVKNQRPISRAWFRVNIFNKKMKNANISLKKNDEDNLFEVCLQKGSELPDSMVNTIWDEVSKPDFNIF